MSFPALQNYLTRLSTAPQPDTRVWIDHEGRAQGRYFNCTLTSAFQPIRLLDSLEIDGYEAFARSYSESDHGLSLWKLLDHAANDDESIELDRLCRMLHAINFYRQPAAQADLYLSVHDRLLTAVSGNHGMAFRSILEGLGLPIEKIILQLPAATPNQRWLLTYVADNYRRNGFRFAVNTANSAEALGVLECVLPDVIKVDARELADEDSVARLLKESRRRGVRLVFKRVDGRKTLDTLSRLNGDGGRPVHVQGYLWDLPRQSINAFVLPFPTKEDEQVPASLKLHVV